MSAELENILKELGFEDVNGRDEHGMTALIMAAGDDNVEAMKLLIEAGADVNAQSKFGDMPLMAAAANGNVEAMKLLMEAGADVNIPDLVNVNALMMAAMNGHVEATKLLIESGADVNAPDLVYGTALLGAAAKGKVETMKLLIEAGADFSVPDMDGKTVLNYAHTDESRALIKKAVKEKIEKNKRNILQSRKLRKEHEKRHPEEKVSGTVIADRIAEDVISGKEKRTITPEVGAELRRKKALEK